jgi:hypothetical protein
MEVFTILPSFFNPNFQIADTWRDRVDYQRRIIWLHALIHQTSAQHHEISVTKPLVKTHVSALDGDAYPQPQPASHISWYMWTALS